jgi:class 3 adenylate cyclase
VIDSIESIEAVAGGGVEILVGLNTGGPLAAGVIGVDLPTFQIVGAPYEIAEQLMIFGVPMQIHITRSVYELIYAHRFRVTDRGEVKVEDGRTLATYVIEP